MTDRPIQTTAHVICDRCEGEGDDGDLLYPMPCDKCRGTGLMPLGSDLDQDDASMEPEDGDYHRYIWGDA